MNCPTKILDDRRPISSLGWGPGGADMAVTVGRSGCTRIVAYGEPGEYCLIPWFAAYYGEEKEPRQRFPASGVIYVEYAPDKEGS